MSIEINKGYLIFSTSLESGKLENFLGQKLQRETKLGLSLDEEECKNSMQSSTSFTRCDSVGSDNEHDLTKVDKDAFYEDLLLIEKTLIALTIEYTGNYRMPYCVPGHATTRPCRLPSHVIGYIPCLMVSSRKNSLQHFKKPWALEYEPVNTLLEAVKECVNEFRVARYNVGLMVSSRKNSLQHFKKPWAHEHEPVNSLLEAVKM
ncbi:unnamed protein product [Lupinus luteus]|uniref:Uncharacterized protein n=1 Tax=Lupinus luteus TaxID=3873 RepID=A0AAV1XTX0_LUPLU